MACRRYSESEVEDFKNSLKFVSREETELNELIYQTIVHLPEEVREFVCDRCRFLSIGGSANALVLSGVCLPHSLNLPGGRWAIEQGK